MKHPVTPDWALRVPSLMRRRLALKKQGVHGFCGNAMQCVMLHDRVGYPEALQIVWNETKRPPVANDNRHLRAIDGA